MLELLDIKLERNELRIETITFYIIFDIIHVIAFSRYLRRNFVTGRFQGNELLDVPQNY